MLILVKEHLELYALYKTLIKKEKRMKKLLIKFLPVILLINTCNVFAATFFKPTFTGKYTEQFVKGGPKYEVNVKKGKKQGLEIFWYESGRIKIQTNYVNDKEDGVWNQWYENGQMKLEAHYKGGREHGSFKQWYENGQQRAQSHFINGKKQGAEYAWDKDGKVTSKLMYKDGQVISQPANTNSAFK